MTFSLFKEVIMMKKLALVAAGFLCTGLLGACSNQGMESSNKSETKQTSTTGSSEQAGKKVQEFNLQGVDGKTYRLSDYKGKKVYLKFCKGDLLKEYGIRSYPSALFIASDGTLAKTHIGYMSKEDIVQTLKEMK